MTREELESRFEDCFDKNTLPTGGGYEADYTSMSGLWSDFLPFILQYSESENAALRQQVKDMGEVIKELRGKSILDSIDVRFDGITVQGDDRILSLTLSRKS